jgi:hypothetical protein
MRFFARTDNKDRLIKKNGTFGSDVGSVGNFRKLKENPTSLILILAKHWINISRLLYLVCEEAAWEFCLVFVFVDL